ALVKGACANGLDVRLEADHGRVPVPVELAAYRIVQESLTNALKHAAPGPVLVRLRQADGTLHVTGTSPHPPGDTPRAPGPARGAGPGRSGRRGRAALPGGGFTAAPEAGLWPVRPTLPLTETEGALS